MDEDSDTRAIKRRFWIVSSILPIMVVWTFVLIIFPNLTDLTLHVTGMAGAAVAIWLAVRLINRQGDPRRYDLPDDD